MSATASRLRGTTAIRVGVGLALLAAAAGSIVPWHAVTQVCGQTAEDEAAPTQEKSSLTGIDVEINPDGYTSSRICGVCHTDIYASWKKSLHAFSLIDPIFDAAYMQAIKEGGEEAKRLCLRCHAPMTLFNDDYDLEQGVTREGVSCDFCHTVTGVQLDQPERPYTSQPGLVKRSVLRKAGSPKHEVAYSELHATAEFCGGCHNYKAPNGTPIMSTYEEWRRGPYPDEGIECQDCHMVLSAGSIVAEEIKKSGQEIHLHNLIHDTDQLRNALDVEITKAERTTGEFGPRLEVEVRVRNVGSGHMVPTGMPSREILLTVAVEMGSQTRTQERRYRRVIGDENGRPLAHDYQMLLYGATIVSDNRIGPREERTEKFSFVVRRSGSVRVTATVSYHYSPMILDQRRLEIKLTEAKRSVL